MSMECVLAPNRLKQADRYPVPLPTSSMLSLPLMASACKMRPWIFGASMDWLMPIGIGVSANANSRYSGGTNASRGTVANTSSTRGSSTSQVRICWSTICCRAANVSMISRARLRLMIMVNFHRLREPLALFSASRWFATCPALEGRPTIKRRYDSSLLRSALVFSSLALWLVTAAILAVGIAVLFVWKRRQERAVNDFSSQIQYLIDEGGAACRIAPGAEPGALRKLGAAVNN